MASNRSVYGRNRNYRSFFKVIRYPAADHMLIPTAWTREHSALFSNSSSEILNDVIIKNHLGQEWRVSITKVNDDYIFTNGWDIFKRANGVKIKEFCVFFLIQTSPKWVFVVDLFEDDGSGKKLPGQHIPNDHPVQRRFYTDSDEEVQVDEEEEQGTVLIRRIGSHYMRKMPLTNAFVEESGLEQFDQLILINDNGVHFDGKFKKWGKAKTAHVSGWGTFVSQNNIKIGDRIKISHAGENILRITRLLSD